MMRTPPSGKKMPKQSLDRSIDRMFSEAKLREEKNKIKIM